MNAEGGEYPRAPLGESRDAGPVAGMGPVNHRVSHPNPLTLREGLFERRGQSLILKVVVRVDEHESYTAIW
jgi:hypothetical protein